MTPRSRKRRSDGEATRAKILDAALRLFRRRGFDATTMRAIADETGLSLGAAYHYFPSKEAIVLAYYESIQDAHQAALRDKPRDTARDRVAALFHAKLDAIGRDRKLMMAVFRGVADPGSPVSIFGKRTAHLRRRSLDEFTEAIRGEPFSDDVRELLPGVLWGAHMAAILYFLHDRSPGQARTRRLVDGAIDLILDLARVASLPALAPMRAKLIDLYALASIADQR